jgi:S-adenosylmethionine decarboxylase
MSNTDNLLGLHILLTLSTKKEIKLLDYHAFIEQMDILLEEYGLEKVGNTHFIFDNNSFTSAICLKESHICIHTWPEIQSVTLDVYLCNYQKDNTHIVKNIANRLIAYFEAAVITKHEIFR